MLEYLDGLGTDRLPVFGEAGEKRKMIRVEHRGIAHQGLAAEKIGKAPGQGTPPNLDLFAPGFFETLLPGLAAGIRDIGHGEELYSMLCVNSTLAGGIRATVTGHGANLRLTQSKSRKSSRE